MGIKDAWSRVVIEGLTPEIDGGRFPVKRIVGDAVVVEAAIVADGHELVSGVLLHRREDAAEWTEVPMTALGDDRFRAEFRVAEIGRYRYTVQAWVDRFRSWARDLRKRLDAGQDVRLDLLIGVALVEAAAERADDEDGSRLREAAALLRGGGPAGAGAALAPDLAALMARHAERPFPTTHHPALGVVVDRERARFSAWYELFPRSCAAEPGRHGTLRDVEARLPYVAGMGFDVLYLPPIHPIGRVNRKGPNNDPVARPGDPGSPWAIGSTEGGHKAIHPELGTLEDLAHLRAAAADLGIELALDIAFQCAPDHPYATEHPEWFRQRPDGTIQYAENPPKKYQDIYPFDFETPDWQALWAELHSVFQFWIDQGIRIFRVDNPHTKPFAFWEWVIAEIKRDHPDTIFLAEAFTRPKVLYRLAKVGFTQSYNYFPWRNTKAEITEYLTELTRTPVREFFGPNLWVNTPDILPEYLQYGGRPGFVARAVLAATLGPSYGLYGPAFEHCIAEPLAIGREEYLDSEKYEIRHWDLAGRRVGQPRSAARRAQPDPAGEPGAPGQRRPALPPGGQQPGHRLLEGDARPVEPGGGGRQPRSAPRPVRISWRCRSTRWASTTGSRTRSTTCWPTRAISGTAPATTSSCDPRGPRPTSSRSAAGRGRSTTSTTTSDRDPPVRRCAASPGGA